MTLNTTEPLEARQWFKLRDPVNWGITLLVFVPMVIVLQVLLPYLVADAIAVAVAFCIHFFFLHKRSIGIECPNPNCGKYILTNTPWVCGVCGTKNLRVDDFPFVGRCENKDCGGEPKAYQCHHCEKLIYLTPDRQTTNYAKCVNMPERVKPPKVRRDKDADEVTRLDKGIQVAERMVKKAKLDAELHGIQEELNPPKPKSVRERLRGKVGGQTELDDEVRQLHAEIDEKFKDDPAERERRHRIVEAEARDLLM